MGPGEGDHELTWWPGLPVFLLLTSATPRLTHASPAPAQDAARRILGEDVTQIGYTTGKGW